MTTNPNDNPPLKSGLQAEIEREAGLDSTFTSLFRKCCTHDCRHDGQYSYQQILPDGTQQYLRAYCNRMDCWTCARYRADTLRAKLNAAIHAHGLLYCYTLTLPGRLSMDEGFNLAMDTLKILKARFKRKFKRLMPYIAVKSLGSKHGHPHLHLLTDMKLPYRWIKAIWLTHTGSHIVHRKVNVAENVERLANYMLNNWLEGYVRGLRGKKVTASHGIDIAVARRRAKTERSSYRRVKMSTRHIAMSVHGGLAQDYPENPRRVSIPSRSAERSEAIAAPDASVGRREDPDAAGGGTGTCGMSASGAALSGSEQPNRPTGVS